MMKAAASLHAGLLARKGEARPSAQGDGGAVFRAAAPASRRDTPAVALDGRLPPGQRIIELPRHLSAVARTSPGRRTDTRRQLHARIQNDLHYRLKVAAARLERTQQDLVASALDAYLAFLDEDVFAPHGDSRTAGA